MGAARYGFKVHHLKVARGLQGRKPILPARGMNVDEVKAAGSTPPAKPVGQDYLNTLTECLTHLQGQADSLTDVPKMIAVADGANKHVASSEPGTPRLVINSLQVTGRRISVEVEYGHLGYAHRAVGVKKKDEADLDDKSPLQYYRHEFLVPTALEGGLVAAEVIAGGSALPALSAWINWAGRELYGDPSFPRLMVPALADEARLKKLLSGQTVAEIELTRKKKTKDGVPSEETVRLIETVKTSSKMMNANALASSWVEQQQGDPYKEAQRLQQVGKLAELVDENATKMGFTDGVVRFREEDGRATTVSPSKSAEIFVYSIAEARPGDTLWLDRTRDQAMKMAAAAKLSVAWD